MAQEQRALATRDASAVLEQVIIKGDLKELKPEERVSYYKQVCESIGVNPLTQPFQYITLNNRLTLYATRGCTDQLRERRKITAHVVSRERMDDVYVVTVRVTIHPGTPDERSDEAIGAVSIGGLKGDFLANALMKAETKGKRRATLSLIGLGWLDESEVETIPGAQPVSAEHVESNPLAQRSQSAQQRQQAHASASDLPDAIQPLQPHVQSLYRDWRKQVDGAATVEALASAWARVKAATAMPTIVFDQLLADTNARKAALSEQAKGSNTAEARVVEGEVVPDRDVGLEREF